ncbi:VOC family protein [Phenylobacterium immobile]|uniref:VOC family protein n=1 Tax=Phenylobacterium immobile TaxID=21 RepID=UPI000B1BA95F|nr:VOC family protein [Phenylobacterium immobile]
MSLLLNIDVPDLPAAERFYVESFGLRPYRRVGGVAAGQGGGQGRRGRRSAPA